MTAAAGMALMFSSCAGTERKTEQDLRIQDSLQPCEVEISVLRQENFNNVPLALDTANKKAIEAGMDDHVCPPADIIGHFERIAAAFGGYEKLGDRCRLFCFHGRGHGGGRFEYGEDNAVLRQKLVDWRERGVAPDVLPYAWKSQGIVIPEPPYPFYAYQDEKGDWQRGKYPENAIRQPDPIYYR